MTTTKEKLQQVLELQKQINSILIDIEKSLEELSERDVLVLARLWPNRFKSATNKEYK